LDPVRKTLITRRADGTFMPLTRRRLVGTAAAVAVAGCLGNGSGNGDEEPTPTATPTDASGDPTPTDAAVPTTVGVRSHDEFGDVLVGPEGMTLYMFEQDTRGAGESTCTGGCADTWPPFTATGGVEAGDGVTADVTTFERESGDRQVAADGWPLYYYAVDDEPGEASGQGVGGVWWVLAPDGAVIRPDSTPTPTSTPIGSGDDGDGGYNY
jgi:predicted lipoprotein with Yx(FWY)xxD motif